MTVFLDVPIETLHKRVAARNANLPAEVSNISAEELNEWATGFQPPTEEELTQP